MIIRSVVAYVNKNFKLVDPDGRILYCGIRNVKASKFV